MICIEMQTQESLYNALYNTIGEYRKIRHGKAVYVYAGAGFDCETTETPKHYAYSYIWQFGLNDLDIIGRKPEKFYDFLIALDKVLVKKYYEKTHKKPKDFPKLLIYIANMGYEWSFYKTIFNKIGIKKVFAKEKRKPLSVQCGKCLEFRECLGLWGVSLENIAENYTNTKKLVGDLDYSIPRNSLTKLTKKEMQYCINDVRILVELGHVTFEKFKNKAIPYTQTGIIRNEVKTRMQSKGKLYFNAVKESVKKIYPRNLKAYIKVMHYLFAGGLTHSNYKYVGKHLQNVQCADLTSDYPAQMAHNNFPAGTMLENCTIDDIERYPHYFALFTFYNVESKNGHTLISEHKLINYSNATFDNGRVYSAGKICVYLNEVDFENFDMFYKYDENKIEINDIHCFTQSKPIPEELFDVLFEEYLKKADLKSNGLTEVIEYIESKKIVNGCFGFTATRIYLTDIKLKNGDFKEVEKIIKLRSVIYNRRTKNKKLNKVYTIKNQAEEVYKELTKNVWLSPWIAVYTTSYARRVLCDIISRFPDVIVQYDTDSIYFLTEHKETHKLLKYILTYNKEIENRNKEIFNNPIYNDLGAWEIEDISEKFKCLGAKRYLKQTKGKVKLVCAGCKSAAFIKYCDENKLDYFEYFTKDMLLSEASSMKTTLRYYDKKEKPYVDTITDLQGNTQTVKIDTCAVITDIPFKLGMNEEWLKFIQVLIENEKRF